MSAYLIPLKSESASLIRPPQACGFDYQAFQFGEVGEFSRARDLLGIEVRPIA